MQDKACLTCEYWQQREDKVGVCRKNAPRAVVFPLPGDGIMGGIRQLVMWPMTGEVEWCGDWKVKLEVTAQAPG